MSDTDPILPPSVSHPKEGYILAQAAPEHNNSQAGSHVLRDALLTAIDQEPRNVDAVVDLSALPHLSGHLSSVLVDVNARLREKSRSNELIVVTGGKEDIRGAAQTGRIFKIANSQEEVFGRPTSASRTR